MQPDRTDDCVQRRRMGGSPRSIVAASSVPKSWVSCWPARPMVELHRAFVLRIRFDPPSVPAHHVRAAVLTDVPNTLAGKCNSAGVGIRRRAHKTAVNHCAKSTYVDFVAEISVYLAVQAQVDTHGIVGVPRILVRQATAGGACGGAFLGCLLPWAAVCGARRSRRLEWRRVRFWRKGRH